MCDDRRRQIRDNGTFDLWFYVLNNILLYPLALQSQREFETFWQEKRYRNGSDKCNLM
jgi:hypothetical protein